MHILRLTGFTLALVAAVVVFLVLGPDDVARFRPISVEGSAALIDQAIADYGANSTNAGEDLELQTVANGWVARDLLYVLANQADALSEQLAVISAQTDAVASGTQADDRVAGLLLVGVITLAFHAATLPFVPTAAVPAPLTHSRPAPAGRTDDNDNDDEDEDRGHAVDNSRS